jgi:solute carrier family 10 (sodium/bile acid cotransporter), member 7
LVFNLLLAAVLVLGLLWPGSGLALEPWRRELTVAVMFLMSVTLPGERLRSALVDVRGLTACALVSWGLLPALGAALAWLLFRDEPGLRAGVVLAAVLPCTLASAAVWTRLARGDDALALVYTVASNLASVAVVPLFLATLLGAERAFELPVGPMMWDLCVVVLFPVAAGQAVRLLVARRADGLYRAVSLAARGLVLAVVLVAVALVSGEARARPTLVLGLVGLVALLHGAGLAAGWGLGRPFGLPRPQRVAVVFAGSQKTIFIGVFLAGEYFPHAPLALLPVTACHVVQLVMDTVVAHRLAPGAAVATAAARSGGA